jgi:hypothetical protein
MFFWLQFSVETKCLKADLLFSLSLVISWTDFIFTNGPASIDFGSKFFQKSAKMSVAVAFFTRWFEN